MAWMVLGILPSRQKPFGGSGVQSWFAQALGTVVVGSAILHLQRTAIPRPLQHSAFSLQPGPQPSHLAPGIGELGHFAVSLRVHNFQRSDLLGLTRTLAEKSPKALTRIARIDADWAGWNH